MRRSGPRSAAARAIALVVLATAVLMSLPFGGSAFWLSVPAALAAASLTRSGAGAALASSVVVGTAAGTFAWRHPAPLPPPVLVILVPLLSVGLFVAMRRRLERDRDRMRDVALTDPLTGVANRRSLMQRAEYEIGRHGRERRSFTVAMIDLDGFKALNDRFGHAAGDEILREVAASLRGALRAQDTLARLGGDEFCLLAPLTGRAGGAALTERLEQAVAHATSGVETLRASLGLAVFPADGTDAGALLQAADERLLQAKRERYRRPRRRAA